MYSTRKARSGSISHFRFLSTAVTAPQPRNFGSSRNRFVDQVHGSYALQQFILYFKQRYGRHLQQQQYRGVSDATGSDSSNIIKTHFSSDQPLDEHRPETDVRESTVTSASCAAEPENSIVPNDSESPHSLSSDSPSNTENWRQSHLYNQETSPTDHVQASHPQQQTNIQLELSQLRNRLQQLNHDMEELEPLKQRHNDDDVNEVNESTTTSVPTSHTPFSAFNGPMEPDLPPLTAPTDIQYATIDELLSLQLSAWDDNVWYQGRWIFLKRFQSHCSSLIHSEHSHQSIDSNTIQSPLSTTYDKNFDVRTISEVQETLNLLHRLCQVRSDTKELNSLMKHFITEVRATIELQNHMKVSNKHLRNDLQYHPRFTITTETRADATIGSNSSENNRNSFSKQGAMDHFNSLSLGTVAHMIEVTIYQIMKNRYWYPDTTTAYQTMIQVAAIATVDHKTYSSATAIHHNPGANSEYWLKQQHQASRMDSQHAQQIGINAPNRYDYSTVLQGWVATSKIEQLHQNTYNPYDVSQHPSVMSVPNQYANDFVSTADVSSPTTPPMMINHGSNDSMAANRAGQLIRQWQFLYSSSDNNPVLKPTESAYANWLTCITNSSTRPIKGAAINAARECHNALREISKRSEKDNFWPGVTLFNILMNAYSKAGDAEAAESVLHDLIEKAKYNTYCVPDVVSFTTVINAWAQIPHNHAAPERAERLFHLQQDFAARSGLESLLPTVTTVTAVLQCWTKSNHPMAPSRAEAILKQMHGMVRAGHPKLQPNVITYNICMNIWCRSGHFDTTNKVEELFEELMDQFRLSNYSPRFKPDAVSYLARISAWEKNRTLTGRFIAEKVESIFNELVTPNTTDAMNESEDRNKLRQPRPNQALYNAIIRVFSNCGDAVTATKYLEAMITDYVDKRNYKAIPNRFVFHYVISAWSKKLSYTGAETAEWWLNRMHYLSLSHPSLKEISPNSVSYSTCLGAWARFPQGRLIIDTDPNIEAAMYEINDDAKNDAHMDASSLQSQPLQSSTMTKCPTMIAMERGQNLYQRMKQNKIRPDVYTYGAILHIISNQKQCTPRAKYSQAQSIVEKMVRDNIEMNGYIYRLLKKCGISSLPNYNLNYTQRNGTMSNKSNRPRHVKNELESTNRTETNHENPPSVGTTDIEKVAESI